MNGTEIYHVYSEDDIIEHDTESLECVCEPEASIERFCDENGNDLDEHCLLIVHRMVRDELKEEGFVAKVLKAMFGL